MKKHLKLLALTLASLSSACSTDQEVVISMYQVLSKSPSFYEERKLVVMKAYFAKRDLPRLFVSQADAQIDNVAASVVLMTDFDIEDCENLYVHVEAYIGRYNNSPFLTVQDVSRLYPVTLLSEVDSLGLDGVHCPKK